MTRHGYLGIDAGTQGLSVLWTDEELNVIAVGEGSYDMISGLDPECYEQSPNDWVEALRQAMASLRAKLPQDESAREIKAIGISGQMHGEVLADAEGNAIGPARLWCDARNEAEGDELTEEFLNVVRQGPDRHDEAELPFQIEVQSLADASDGNEQRVDTD